METMRASVEPVASVAAAGSRATVIDITPFLACLAIPEAESTNDPLWGDLLRQAVDAWTWRDPESLSALASVVTKLKALVLAEWQ
jgi:hypothetical protein